MLPRKSERKCCFVHYHLMFFWGVVRILVPNDIQYLGAASEENTVLRGLAKFVDFIPNLSSLPYEDWTDMSPQLSGCDKQAQDVVINALELINLVDCEQLTLMPSQLSKLLLAGLFAPGLIGLRPSDGKDSQNV